MKTRLTFFALFLMALLLLAAPAGASPLLDGGGFPTATPTITNTPEPTFTATQPPVVIVTLESGYPPPTQVIEGLDPGQPSNIQEEATRRAETEAANADSGGNPLITAAYIGLFILLVVGVWMLFSRRGLGP